MTRFLIILAVCAFTGCVANHGSEPVVFLGIPESQQSDQGPVGLINGQPSQIKNVTAVSEVPYEQYKRAQLAGRVFVEETHGDYVYFAIQEQRDIQFDNASAWIDVIERFKAKK